ncbi:hypothetical protein K7X08_036800 [Anisodus acutangulus]|uniref:malate dehydrogenase n=1 Tax=Anisodus acutangulus TaxID=402998 RepID=A0A9Q1L994_9SOLA|nr:hypothetical protein K7X08_036800 [Anisodus acutangulus]
MKAYGFQPNRNQEDAAIRAEVHQRIARISAHLYPSNPQIGEGSMLERANCRAKGGAPGFKVAILGAAGGIGQPLAMLMKMNHLVSVLHLYDVVNAPGVTADISHMDTGAVCEGLSGANGVFKNAGTYDPKKLLGVTSLDVVRANTFVAEVLGLDPREVEVPVVGGHAGMTILPLLSQVKPPCSFTPEETEYLTKRIQDGGTEVVGAKKGAGSATLSMAYAAVKFADACLKGLRGDACVVACAFVASQVTELPFFASKVRLGRTGAEEVYQLGPLNEYERIGLEKAKKELAESIQKGISFIRN